MGAFNTNFSVTAPEFLIFLSISACVSYCIARFPKRCPALYMVSGVRYQVIPIINYSA